MRKIYTRLTLLAAALTPMSPPLMAQAPQSDAPPATVQAWVNSVNARINAVMTNRTGLNGTVQARFRRGEDGRATDIRLHRATPAMARAARLTLQRVGALPPLPQGIDRRQPIKLQLLFGAGYDTKAFEHQRREMLAMADTANGRIGRGRATMVAELSRNP
jgi:hypothetical protein